MRPIAPFGALLLIAAVPGFAHADGIERPHHVIHRRHSPPPTPLVQPPITEGPETVTLSQAFFAGSPGGVGADISGSYDGGGTIMVSSGGARSVAIAFASAGPTLASGFIPGGHLGEAAAVTRQHR